MNTHRVKCVIDSDGYFVCVVLFTSHQIMQHQTGKEETIETPYAYTLKDGESFINASVPVGCIKPRWNGTNWEETATPEEIEAARLEMTTKQPATPTIDQRLYAMENAMLAMMTGGMSSV